MPQRQPDKTIGKPAEAEITPEPQQVKRRSRAAQIRLTPAVEAALAAAAADLPLSPSEIVDTAVRDWLRIWRPDLM